MLTDDGRTDDGRLPILWAFGSGELKIAISEDHPLLLHHLKISVAHMLKMCPKYTDAPTSHLD